MNVRFSSGAPALEVRRELRARVAGLRSRREVDDPAVPRWVEEDTYRFRGRLMRRMRVILRSNGCSHPTCTMCPFPNEGASRATTVPDEAMVEQVRHALAANGPAEMVCVYNDGSFFADVELSSDARREICRLVSESGAETMMVESLPHLITEARLDGVLCALGSTQLAVGIGLQAVDRVVRELCVNSPVRLAAFVRAHALLRSRGQFTKAYVMLKPPFLTEVEGIEQAVSSVVWLSRLGVADVAICPTRIVEGTLAAELYEAGMFFPPGCRPSWRSFANSNEPARTRGCRCSISPAPTFRRWRPPAALPATIGWSPRSSATTPTSPSTSRVPGARRVTRRQATRPSTSRSSGELPTISPGG
jgi:archaeosine synthase beta-subunit